MARILLFLFAFLSMTSTWAFELSCEAWHQTLGGELNEAPMPTISSSNQMRTFKVQHQNYVYTCNWDVTLDTFYKKIETAEGNRILFTTARVPTFNHNDSFTDLILPDGTRLAIHCSFK